VALVKASYLDKKKGLEADLSAPQKPDNDEVKKCSSHKNQITPSLILKQQFASKFIILRHFSYL